MQTEATKIREWEQEEVRRSDLEAQLTQNHDLQYNESEMARYLNPPANTVYALEYAYYLLGDVRGRTVMDLGCGSGENTVLLARRGARVYGTDISESLIAIAEKRLSVNGIHDGVEFYPGSAHEMPFPDESVDVVFGMAILHHLDLELTSREVWRVLRPGGYAIFKEPVRNSKALKFIRRLIPYQAPDVSPYERPLTDEELEQFGRRFSKYHTKSFQLPYVNVAEILPVVRNFHDSLLRFDYKLLKRVQRLQRHASVKVMKVIK